MLFNAICHQLMLNQSITNVRKHKSHHTKVFQILTDKEYILSQEVATLCWSSTKKIHQPTWTTSAYNHENTKCNTLK